MHKRILSILLLTLFSLGVSAQDNIVKIDSIIGDSAKIEDIESRLTEFRKLQYQGIIFQVVGGIVIGIGYLTDSESLPLYIAGGTLGVIGSLMKIASYHKLKRGRNKDPDNDMRLRFE